MRKAFSLIELLIVIAILGLIVGLVGPALMKQFSGAKKKLTCTQMAQISEALDTFKLDNGILPTTDEGLKALISNPDQEKYPNFNGPYFRKGKLPKDSWKRAFQYINSGDTFDIISLGADGKEGGDGDSADIYYSKCQK